MKKIIYSFLFVLLICFSLACDTGCIDGYGNCFDSDGNYYNYGDIVTIGFVSSYSDFEEDRFVEQKTSGYCLNDYECVEGSLCLEEECTNDYNSFLANFSLYLENSSGLCLNPSLGWFCSNVSPSNSIRLINQTCNDAISSCYKCDNTRGYFFNNSLKLCITGVCGGDSFCLDDRINYSTNNLYYCSGSKKCYQCDDDFKWNETLGQCVMIACDEKPGCIDAINLSNGYLVGNRSCDMGSCFSCNKASKYFWNNTSSSCVYTPNAIISDWKTVVFTDSELSLGTYKMLDVGNNVSITFSGRSYYFGLFSVSSRISFAIAPVIYNQTLYPGDTRGFDLDSDGTYDIRVTLANISSGRANVSLKRVAEDYLSSNNDGSDTNDGYVNSGNPGLDNDVGVQTNSEDNLNLDASSATGSFVSKNIWVLIIIAIVFVSLLIWLMFYLLGRKAENKPVSNVSNNVNSSAPIQPRPPVMPGNAPGMTPIGGYCPIQQRPVVMPQNPQVRQN